MRRIGGARRRAWLCPTRPVTPEVAGSSPVAPVKSLQIGLLCWRRRHERAPVSRHPALIPPVIAGRRGSSPLNPARRDAGRCNRRSIPGVPCGCRRGADADPRVMGTSYGTLTPTIRPSLSPSVEADASSHGFSSFRDRMTSVEQRRGLTVTIPSATILLAVGWRSGRCEPQLALLVVPGSSNGGREETPTSLGWL
jgi:hypothetical protein